jgi:Domain of unknown function (DUF6391)
MSILDLPILSRIRRNHGLEHATITLLSQRFPYRRMAGYSFPGGFFLLGDVPTEEVREVVAQALSRMNNGERHLAIHPNCGTNYAVSGLLAGTLAWLGMAGTKSKRSQFERLPLVIVLATLGFMVSAPLGPKVQEYITTSGDPQGLAVVDIFPVRFGRFSIHRVITKG